MAFRQVEYTGDDDASSIDLTELIPLYPRSRSMLRNREGAGDDANILSTIWNAPSNKLKLAVMLAAILGCGAYMTGIAIVGLTVILVTGGLLTVGALAVILTTCAMIAVIVTGVPAGYLLYRHAGKIKFLQGPSQGT